MSEPIHPISGGGAISIGLTKREWFSAMAMQGLLANSYQQDMLVQKPLSTAGYDDIARMAIDQADALMALLSKAKNLEDRLKDCEQIAEQDGKDYSELKAKFNKAMSLATHRFDCTIMTNGKHECSCGYNELKGEGE